MPAGEGDGLGDVPAVILGKGQRIEGKAGALPREPRHLRLRRLRTASGEHEREARRVDGAGGTGPSAPMPKLTPSPRATPLPPVTSACPAQAAPMARRSASDSASQTSHGVPCAASSSIRALTASTPSRTVSSGTSPLLREDCASMSRMRFASVMGVSGWLRMEVSCSSLSPTKR